MAKCGERPAVPPESNEVHYHRRLPTVSGSDLTASCSAEQSSPVLVASVYFVLLCSIILHSVLRVLGSRGHPSLSPAVKGVRGCYILDRCHIDFILIYFIALCIIKMVLIFYVCFIVAVLLFRANSFIQYIYPSLSF